MMYRCPDGKVFSSHSAFCDHMVMLSLRCGDMESAKYYTEEKEKMIKRQEKHFPFFAAIMILGIIGIIICVITQP